MKSQGICRRTKCGKMPTNCLIPKTGVQHQSVGVTGEREEGRRWLGDGPNSYREKVIWSWRIQVNLLKCVTSSDPLVSVVLPAPLLVCNLYFTPKAHNTPTPSCARVVESSNKSINKIKVAYMFHGPQKTPDLYAYKFKHKIVPLLN
jgi:hypothetical protein